MRNAEHEHDAKDLGLSAEEIVWVARVTRCVWNRLGMSRDHAGAEDALQVVHVEIWESRALLSNVPRDQRRAWLNTLVVRTVLHHHHKQLDCHGASLEVLVSREDSRGAGAGGVLAQWLTMFASGLADAVEDEELLRAVLRLHPRDYRILELHIFLELSDEDGGRMLGISASAFARRRQRIVARLRAELVPPAPPDASRTTIHADRGPPVAS